MLHTEKVERTQEKCVRIALSVPRLEDGKLGVTYCPM